MFPHPRKSLVGKSVWHIAVNTRDTATRHVGPLPVPRKTRESWALALARSQIVGLRLENVEMGMIDDAKMMPVVSRSLPESCFVGHICFVDVDSV